jgi:prevent-host-death family protein
MTRARTVTAFDAKNRLGRLLDRVQAGEELVITRHGKPVARLVPVKRKDRNGMRQALETFRTVRQALVAAKVRVSRQEVRAWRNEGRR